MSSSFTTAPAPAAARPSPFDNADEAIRHRVTRADAPQIGLAAGIIFGEDWEHQYCRSFGKTVVQGIQTYDREDQLVPEISSIFN